jgi:hypothetical protein
MVLVVCAQFQVLLCRGRKLVGSRYGDFIKYKEIPAVPLFFYVGFLDAVEFDRIVLS